MRMMALAFEVQHRVDDVLERLRAGEVAVLRDVADEHRRDVLSFRGEQKLRGRLAHLADAAGRRLELDREDGLDRVDDDERRLQPRDLFEDALDACLGQQVERRGADAKAIAAALDLVLGLFAGCVENRADLAREVRGRLQQQRRLADARLAAEQHERTGHDAAAEHAIELADAGRQPDGVSSCQLLRTVSRCRMRLPARTGAPQQPRRPRPGRQDAPRQASSRRRNRCSVPATSALARRIPDRRTRLWGTSYALTGHRGTETQRHRGTDHS